MRLKLVFLGLFTAIVSVACASYPRGASQDGMQLGARHNLHAPITIQRTDSVLGGRCQARLTFDRQSGNITKIETDPPCVVKSVGEERLLVNGHEVVDLSGSITFSGSCRIYYGSAGQYVIDPTRNC